MTLESISSRSHRSRITGLAARSKAPRPAAWTSLLVAGLGILALVPDRPRAQSEAPLRAQIEPRISAALAELELEPRHFSLPDDYNPRDIYRLAWIDHLLRDPASLPVEVDALAAEIERAAASEDWPALGADLNEVLRSRSMQDANGGRSAAPSHPRSRAGGSRAPERSTAGRAVHSPGASSHSRDTRELGAAVESIFRRTESAVRAGHRRAFLALPEDTLRWVAVRAIEMVRDDPDQGEKDLFEFERDAEASLRIQERVRAHLRRIDRGALLDAGRAALAGVRELRALLPRDATTGPARAGAGGHGAPGWGRPGGSSATHPVWTSEPRVLGSLRVTGEILAHGESPSGPWVVGGSGPNVYEGRFGCIVDLGGDDLYVEHGIDAEIRPESDAEVDRAAGSLPPLAGLRCIVDLGGDDRYLGRGLGVQGGGFFDAHILWDLAGDDLYETDGIAQGAGFFGSGWLIDGGGHDDYRISTFGQGAGLFGVGALVDLGGSDAYVSGTYAQGYGSTAGLGLLHDASGNDRYATASTVDDLLRHQDGHAIAFTQGSALGMRPYTSGGVGLLIDSDGHDSYQSDTFGQGSAYWYGLGAVIDRDGHDVYDAFVYTQGSGVHMGLGLVLDDRGNDRYLAKGVSQGCGHDLGCGWLHDRGGQDVYVAHDLSQGAGNANGFGVLFDEDGDDQYVAQIGRQTHGYGNPRRESGSLGLLVDGAGRDVFLAGNALRDSTARGSNRGLRLDLPGENRPGPQWEAAAPRPVPDRAFTPQELFWMASTGQPQFADHQKLGAEKLGEGTPEILRYLRSRLGVEDARDRRTIELAFQATGARAIPYLTDSLKSGGYNARLLAATSLGRIEDETAAPHLVQALNDPAWQVRAAVASALGRTGGAGAWVALVRVVRDDPAPWVRKAALAGLYRLDPDAARPHLDAGARDPDLFVRLAALDRLAKLEAAAADPTPES